MSHGDEAKKLPEGFTVVAKSEQVLYPKHTAGGCVRVTIHSNT
jgi:GMP synthase-like glutamine amidotransferase